MTLNRTLGVAAMPAIIFVFLLNAGCSKKAPDKPEPAELAAIQAKVATISLEDAASYHEATGTVKPKLSATLSSKVMARVVSVSVREGDRVRRGDVLVTLDSRELASAVGMARANENAAVISIKNARESYAMEVRASAARIAEAEARVSQAASLLGIAKSRLDLALAGPRTQERAQASLAVAQAQSNLQFASTELERTKRLVDEGAIAKRQLDVSQNAYNQAKAQYETALESEKIAREGTRAQDVRAAEEGVAQAQAALKQAEAGVRSARAAATMVRVRAGEIQSAQAQAIQSRAAVSAAEVGASYAKIVAPFDGLVVRRFVDPGAMAAIGVPLMVVDGDELRLEAIVPESVVESASLGSSSRVEIDAISPEAFDGIAVETVPQADPSSHSFLVRYRLPSDTRIRSGMFGKVLVPVGRNRRLLIPSSAFWEVEGLRYVFVVNRENIARLRIITVGSPQGDRIEVLSGLQAGERIVVGDRAKVVDGIRIEAN